jgi:hypothetical protein
VPPGVVGVVLEGVVGVLPGVVGVVGVPPGLVGVVGLPGVVGSVGVVSAVTTTVPVILGCRSQMNLYVPTVSNLQSPLQPGPVGTPGSGGTGPEDGPAVCAHDDGCGPEPKSALWAVAPEG